jgi:hypothetical protein
MERKEFNKLLEICKGALQNDVVLLDDPFEDEIDDLLFLTAVYGQQISRTMESTVDFTVGPLRVAHLDEVQCVNDFRFRKRDFSNLIDALRLPLSHFLVFCGDTDYVRCRHNYKIPYETGVLLVIFRLARPHRIRSDMERMFHCRRSKICAAFNTFIDVFSRSHRLTSPIRSSCRIVSLNMQMPLRERPVCTASVSGASSTVRC